ncbi:PilN domain-containing protein [Granulibacter bethesdensis]|uniref:PilN domain-containing protein n=1 Tax=Granulibacter bethesdensis TaxID=364410 RepID=UPI00090C8E04|nr:PilN domain-containing protein [Granulibacter bethesdensis]APH60120.1 General secretion pathway protein L [Granulibacter bethesdensis]
MKISFAPGAFHITRLLAPVRKALKPLSDKIGTFFTWWGTQLAAALPSGVRARLLALAGRHENLLRLSIVEQDDDPLLSPRVTLSLIRGTRVQNLGIYRTTQATDLAVLRSILDQWQQRATPVLHSVGISPLMRTVTLSITAEEWLDRVLAHEMDRLTPFTADTVLWTYDILSRDQAQQKLTIRLHLLPSSWLPPHLSWLNSLGFFPRQVEAETILFPIRNADIRERNRGRYAIAARWAWAGCAALLILTVATPFIHQSMTLGRLDKTIASLKPEAQAASALRRTNTAEQAKQAALAEGGGRSGDVLGMLKILTDALPDDSFISDLTLSRRAITISGQSGAAAQLMASFSNNPFIRNAAFTAPVMRSPDEKTDLFAIRLDIRPEARP